MINKKILVVGGAGYIGAHIVDLLCDKEYNVVVFDDLSTGFQENLNKKAIFIKGSILDIIKLKEVFRNNVFDAVIHMAASKAAGESMIYTHRYSENNIIGSINLINEALENKIKKIIFSSTAAVYGNPLYSPVDEKHPKDPINHYGFTKLCIENYLLWLSKTNDFKFIALRYFNAAGYSTKSGLIKIKEKNPQNLLPIVMEVANNKRKHLEIFGDDYQTKDGTCIRDYISVVDLADAHIKSLEYLDYGKSDFINLSTNSGSSILDVVNVVKEVTNQEISFKFAEKRDGDPAILISSYSRAKKLLKWVPRNSKLEDIIKSMWRYYKNK